MSEPAQPAPAPDRRSVVWVVVLVLALLAIPLLLVLVVVDLSRSLGYEYDDELDALADDPVFDLVPPAAVLVETGRDELTCDDGDLPQVWARYVPDGDADEFRSFFADRLPAHGWTVRHHDEEGRVHAVKRHDGFEAELWAGAGEGDELRLVARFAPRC